MAKMRDGAQWLSNHYAANDYYCEGEHVVGSWVGKGAEILGIAGQQIEPQNEAFLAIFSGQTPEGEALKQRDSDIIGYDFQCSAQKSVSIMAILGGDARLLEAHRAAVLGGYQALETLACVQGRDEQGNKRRTTTGVLCSARFDHDASRALDPQIHTHFATANFSITPEGKRFALETHDMVKAIRYAGKIYQSALRRKVEELGYRTRDKFNERGQIEGFEIVGISDELCDKYSQRRAEIEERIADFKDENGREPTTAEIHVIAKETRTSKLIEISTEAVRAQQRARSTAEELSQIERVKAQAYARKETQTTSIDVGELVSFVREHLAERRATFGEHDLIAEALNRGMGKVSLAELETAIQADPDLVRLDQQTNAMAVLTNQANHHREHESVALVNAGSGNAAPINSSFVPFPELVERDGRWLKEQSNGIIHDYTDQRAAVEAMLRSTDPVFVLRGVAGAGKTTALKQFHAGVVAAGKNHILLAPTTKAVEALAREIPGAQVQTVESFLLASQKGGQQLQDAVITVDEWGLLSNRSGHALLRIAKEHGALVRFVGDTLQGVAVEAGDFGRTLECFSNLRVATISKISRQRDPEYRAAVMEMAASNVPAGLDILDQKGWIHEEKSSYLIKAAERYLELSDFGRNLVTERGEPHVLAIGPTHAEIRAFTADVRAAMRSEGTLSGPVIKRRAFIAHDTTRAMRRDSNAYRPGTAVTLVSEKAKVRGLSAREVYTVKEKPKKKDFVTLVDEHGKEHTINVHANGEKLELGAIGEIELQAGDRLWFRANSSGVTNGTLASLAGTDEQERLVTTDGFVVPDDYLKIAHGYATTSYSSQGLTSNFAVVFGAAFDQKAIYVSHSRARQRVDTYVPSKEAFLSRAERAKGERLGVLEAIADAKKKNESTKQKPMNNIQVRKIDDPEWDLAQREEPERQHLTVPKAKREEEKIEAAWVMSSGDPQKEQKTVPPIDEDPRSQWDFRIGKNGVIEHFRGEDGRTAVRETGDKIETLDQDHDSAELALKRAVERFGTHLHYDGNQAGARTLVAIVVTHDLPVTFTDDRLNAQIQLRRSRNNMDIGRSIVTSEQEQTADQKHSADANESTPEPDGQVASQQTGEVFVDCGAARFNFDEKNDHNYFVRTITPQGEQRIYWGKDLPRSLEEAGATVGDSITLQRVASKPVTVEQVQEQPDGTKQVVRVDTKRNSWQVDNHGVNRQAVIKACDGQVKSPDDRKKLEISAPLLVAERDRAVVEIKREKLDAELAQCTQNHTNRRRI